MFKKILIIGFNKNSLDEDFWNRIDNISENIVFLDQNSKEIQKELSDTDCLLVKFNPVLEEWIDNAPLLKYIGVLATGYGKVPINYAKDKNIIVTNVPGYSTESVAEFVFGMILEYTRELSKAKQQAIEKNYDESGFGATEIYGKTFGIIGAGEIGSRVAEISQGFGAHSIYWNRNKKTNLDSKGIKYQDIKKLLKESDIISLHLALANDTENFLNAENIVSIKKGAIILNTSPMELIDLDALEKRLKIGDITFILDHSDEMTQEDLDRLSQYKNCIIYPPIGYISDEAKQNQQEIFVSNIEEFCQGKQLNIVN